MNSGDIHSVAKLSVTAYLLFSVSLFQNLTNQHHKSFCSKRDTSGILFNSSLVAVTQHMSGRRMMSSIQTGEDKYLKPRGVVPTLAFFISSFWTPKPSQAITTSLWNIKGTLQRETVCLEIRGVFQIYFRTTESSALPLPADCLVSAPRRARLVKQQNKGRLRHIQV